MANSHVQGLSLRTRVHVMTIGRITLGINKAEDDGGYMPKSGSPMRVHQQNPRRVLR